MKEKPKLEFECGICQAIFATNWKICPDCGNIASIVFKRRILNSP